jgi:hypothetical protein
MSSRVGFFASGIERVTGDIRFGTRTDKHQTSLDQVMLPLP